MPQHRGTVVLLTGDDLAARRLKLHLEPDGIEVIRTTLASEAWQAMSRHRPQAVIVDLSNPAVNGDQLVSLSVRTRRAETPLLLLSRQSRRDLVAFAALIRAGDVLSKSEPMTSIAARIRTCVAATPAGLIGTSADGFAIVTAH